MVVFVYTVCTVCVCVCVMIDILEDWMRNLQRAYRIANKLTHNELKSINRIPLSVQGYFLKYPLILKSFLKCLKVKNVGDYSMCVCESAEIMFMMCVCVFVCVYSSIDLPNVQYQMND